jgi:lysophospholipase L1-like esterase
VAFHKFDRLGRHVTDARVHRACVVAAFVCCELLFQAQPSAAQRALRCLTPAAEGALRDLNASGALQRALGSDLSLQELNIAGSQIELQVEDREHRRYGVTLAVAGSTADSEERSGRFKVSLTAPPGSEGTAVSKTLLAAASLVDDALPETALADCSGNVDASRPTPDGEPQRARGTAAVATGTAVGLLAAILFGVLVLRARARVSSIGLPHPAADSRRRWGLRAVLLTFGIVSGLILCELSARVVRWWTPESFVIDDPVRPSGDLTQRAHAKGIFAEVAYTIDADGFRNGGNDGPYDRTVLFIGDSFTFGYGVLDDQTLETATRQQLWEQGVQARCLNAGVVGFGTGEELRLMRDLLERQRVDAVVFQVLPENDLSDNCEDGGFGIEDERLVEYQPHRLAPRIQLRHILVDASRNSDSAMLSLVVKGIYRHGWLKPAVDESQYALERALLKEVVSVAASKHIPLLIFSVPMVPHLMSEESRPAHARVVECIAASGARRIDLDQLVSQPEYYLGDGHFSAAGNALVGAALAEELAPLLR